MAGALRSLVRSKASGENFETENTFMRAELKNLRLRLLRQQQQKNKSE